MEQQRALDDERTDRRPEAAPQAEPRRRGRGGAVGWLLLLLVLAGAGLFYHFMFSPMLAERSSLRAEAQGASERELEQRGRLTALEAQLAELRGEREALGTQRDRLLEERGRLASTVEARETEIAQLQAAQDSLQERMGEEIRRGDILIQNENGELRVKLADQILFGPGGSELSARGQAVIRRVADTLVQLEGHVIEVSGHTDSTPLSERIQERFATNWELSTARATHVVRFLEDECSVPGERLAATGYSQFRPVAGNASSAGRRRNRRIELTLRPRATETAGAASAASADEADAADPAEATP